MQLLAALLHQQHLWRALSLSVSLGKGRPAVVAAGLSVKGTAVLSDGENPHTAKQAAPEALIVPQTNNVFLPAVRSGPILWASGHCAVPSIPMDAMIKPKYKLALYLGFYKYSQIFCLGVDIYFFCASGKVINTNTRMPATKAQSQGIDGILARTGKEKYLRSKPMQIPLVWGLLCKCKHSSGLSKGSQT